jgi:hypothetical protein
MNNRVSTIFFLKKVDPILKIMKDYQHVDLLEGCKEFFFLLTTRCPSRFRWGCHSALESHLKSLRLLSMGVLFLINEVSHMIFMSW